MTGPADGEWARMNAHQGALHLHVFFAVAIEVVFVRGGLFFVILVVFAFEIGNGFFVVGGGPFVAMTRLFVRVRGDLEVFARGLGVAFAAGLGVFVAFVISGLGCALACCAL